MPRHKTIGARHPTTVASRRPASSRSEQQNPFAATLRCPGSGSGRRPVKSVIPRMAAARMQGPPVVSRFGVCCPQEQLGVSVGAVRHPVSRGDPRGTLASEGGWPCPEVERSKRRCANESGRYYEPEKRKRRSLENSTRLIPRLPIIAGFSASNPENILGLCDCTRASAVALPALRGRDQARFRMTGRRPVRCASARADRAAARRADPEDQDDHYSAHEPWCAKPLPRSGQRESAPETGVSYLPAPAIRAAIAGTEAIPTRKNATAHRR